MNKLNLGAMKYRRVFLPFFPSSYLVAYLCFVIASPNSWPVLSFLVKRGSLMWLSSALFSLCHRHLHHTHTHTGLCMSDKISSLKQMLHAHKLRARMCDFSFVCYWPRHFMQKTEYVHETIETFPPHHSVIWLAAAIALAGICYCVGFHRAHVSRERVNSIKMANWLPFCCSWLA